ncbi:hypothetical protein N9891_01410 [bacterium]|nr:hypothetical protein [bacterium]
MRLAGSLQKVYETYGEKADFWWVYIEEAHASDSNRPSRTVEIENHKTIDDRKAAATGCTAVSPLKVPVLIDDMKNSASNAYSAKPERLFILGADGKVAYAGGRGPRGVDVAEFEKALKGLTTKSE